MGARAPPPPPPPTRLFEEGAQGGISITSGDNAMLSGSDGQNYQPGGGAFVGLGGAPMYKISSVTYA